MRFLRMLTNSLLAGGLGAAYLTVLVLQVNPDVPLLSGTVWRWFVSLAATYGLLLSAGFFVLIVTRELFSLEALSPGWASVRVLAWMSATAAAVAATLMWLNASAFRTALGEIAARRMTAGALATTAAAIALLVIAVVHDSYGRRGRRVGGALFTLAALASLILPLAARGAAVPRPDAPAATTIGAWSDADVPDSARIEMLLLDGASLEHIRARSADGRLPHFSRLLESGASMYLATLRPTQPAPVWSSIATGMYPPKSGVRSAVAYYAPGDTRPVHLLPGHCSAHALVRLGILRAQPHTSEAWRARPFWDILSRYGISSGIVRWPLTDPAPPVQGFILGDRFHTLDTPDRPRAAYPPALLREIAMPQAPEPSESETHEPLPTAAAQRDRLYSNAIRVLQARRPTRLAALRLEGLDAAGHRHVSADVQPAFREEDSDAARRSGAQQLEQAYADADAEVGRVLDLLRPGDLLLVVSAFGMQRPNAAKALLARAFGDPASRGTHERAPDGFLMAYGTSVSPGRLPRGSIVDVTPTVLYFLGVPIGRDMDGFVRTDLFTSDFTAERPIAFIATHN